MVDPIITEGGNHQMKCKVKESLWSLGEKCHSFFLLMKAEADGQYPFVSPGVLVEAVDGMCLVIPF